MGELIVDIGKAWPAFLRSVNALLIQKYVGENE
jgi:hypothetical protein